MGDVTDLGRYRANRCHRAGCKNYSPTYDICSQCFDEWVKWKTAALLDEGPELTKARYAWLRRALPSEQGPGTEEGP